MNKTTIEYLNFKSAGPKSQEKQIDMVIIYIKKLYYYTQAQNKLL